MPDGSETKLPSAPQAGSDLRQRVETLGSELADSLRDLLASMPRRAVGPQMLAKHLGITLPTASRLLKALNQTDPIATLRSSPGPNPLKGVIAAALENDASAAACEQAAQAVGRFDELIRSEAGDRSSLDAMLTAWLPGARLDFEAQRRQSVFKAMCELDGVSASLDLVSILLHPGSEPGKIDVVNIKALLGIDRIRPDAVVQVGTNKEADGPRMPTNLDGDPAIDGFHTVRLDEFCDAPPAPLEANRFGSYVQYSLGPTGFGPASKVDLVIAEVNRNELEYRGPNAEAPTYFYSIPDMASRRMVFDLLVHQDLFPDRDPSLLGYATSTRGPAAAGDPARHLDRRTIAEGLEPLGSGSRRLRLLDFPRYGELNNAVFEKLGWDAEEFRAYRVTINYPLIGTQVMLSFP